VVPNKPANAGFVDPEADVISEVTA
jgi:hypothetical protein